MLQGGVCFHSALLPGTDVARRGVEGVAGEESETRQTILPTHSSSGPCCSVHGGPLWDSDWSPEGPASPATAHAVPIPHPSCQDGLETREGESCSRHVTLWGCSGRTGPCQDVPGRHRELRPAPLSLGKHHEIPVCSARSLCWCQQ